MKIWKKNLVEKMVESGNCFYFKKVANEMGINHLKREQVEGIMKSYLLKRPDMKAYYDDSNHNSLFCGLWFAEKTMIFEEA